MNREAERALRAVAENFLATREDLERIAGSLDGSLVPTLGAFAPQAVALLTGRTLDTYRHHIRRLVAEFGDRRLDEVSLLDLERLAIQTRTDAVSVRGARHGFGAQETFVNATRFVFLSAVKAGHIRENPAVGLPVPAAAGHRGGHSPPMNSGPSSAPFSLPAETPNSTCSSWL